MLFSVLDVNAHYLVRKLEELQSNGDLVSVGGGPGVECDCHCFVRALLAVL